MTTMTETGVTTQVYQVFINATPQAIWDAITRPEWTEQLRLPGTLGVRPAPGRCVPIVASDEMRAMGMAEQLVDGEVIEADPPRRLVQTWRFLWDEQIASEGPTRVTFEIDEGPGGASQPDGDPRARERPDHGGLPRRRDRRRRRRVELGPQRPQDAAGDRRAPAGLTLPTGLIEASARVAAPRSSLERRCGDALRWSSGGGTRTHNPSINSRMLCLIELPRTVVLRYAG